MKVEDNSLTEKDREALKREAATIVLGSSAEEYIERIVSIVNPANIGRMYEGYLSIPRYDPYSGYHIHMWSSEGSIHTPGYREEYQEKEYKYERRYHYELNFWQNKPLLY